MATTATATTLSMIGAIGGPKQVYGDFNYYEGRDDPAEDDLRMFERDGPDNVAYKLPVQNLRQTTEETSLDKHGFQVLKHCSTLLPPLNTGQPTTDFRDENVTKALYWPEICTLLRSTLNARAALIVNTTVRGQSPGQETKINHLNPRAGQPTLAPFFIVHGDYTPAGARAHLRAMLPTFYADNNVLDHTTEEERETFLRLRSEIIASEDQAVEEAELISHSDWDGSNYTGPRYAMFSIWRPLSTVKRDPLALMDYRSADAKAETHLARRYRNRPGFEAEYRSTNLLPRGPKDGEEHKWYWLSEQKTDEVYAIKLFDSEANKKGSQVAKCCPHSAFSLEGTDAEEPRRSVELRAMVIW